MKTFINKKYITVTLMMAMTIADSPITKADLPVNIGIAKAKTRARAKERTGTDTKNIEVKNFTSVAAGGPIQVVITLGDKESVKFEGDEEAISTLIAEVKGNALIIRPQMSWTSWAHKYKDKKIIAHVNAKTIKSLTMSGDGSIIVKGTISQNSLSATLSGSGSITANIIVGDFTAVISGSGKLNISGEADNVNATISGSGTLGKKDALKVGNLSSTISGSGSVYIHTDGEIKAFFSGSGSVYYTGNANVTERVLLGSGRVKKI